MNKILVEVSVGELLDKISILEIKKEKIKDPKKLNFNSYKNCTIFKPNLAEIKVGTTSLIACINL